MTKMIEGNSVNGFKSACTALWDYDMTAELASIRAPTLLVAGEDDADGAVAKVMHGFRDKVTAHGSDMKVVANTGHLPMCENPNSFWEAVRDFL